ncbi:MULTISPECIES: CDP-alcohol phosphatidyltransferase family protein [Streptomyces]|uniref:CDP-alcohol phosphatidyltransferase family protein n=1 Tax=Streptomyces TaxID=1883 RepID=UPI001E41DAAB|nr:MULTISPECIES: CDP-alcohol phosphatidyltransferase family protein [Streptomyces]UFQ18738.1 CDP-alcohol phosphatidyltransferase family protein [Streptomyces huasconensis]WCL88355.1 CDP-alcohol phosphatidyltransferase family protein [Streptomyces sp. JCM 35825]
MGRLSLKAVQRQTCKKRDAWWTVLLVDPVATRLLCVLARFKRVTPNGVTWSALLLGLAAAGFFVRGDRTPLAIGALLYHVSFILDCVDGKLARLKGNGTVFGGWLDYVFDRVRVLCCAVALMGGQYLRTGNAWYLGAALAVVFLDMLRYVDALQIYKMRMSMRRSIETLAAERQAAAATGQAVTPVVFLEDLLREDPDLDPDEQRRPSEVPVIDLHARFRGRFPWYARVRRALVEHRIRPHLVSGIEFQMAVFIVAPLIGQILPVTLVAGLLLAAFELAIMYKFWLSTRDFSRVMEKFDEHPAAARLTGVPVKGRHRRMRDRSISAPAGSGLEKGI